MKHTDTITAEYNQPFEKIVAEVWANEHSAEVEIEARPRTFFAVAAIDEMGNRSGYSAIAVYPDDEVMPDIGAAWGSAQTPDGSIFVVNSDIATVYGVTPKSGLYSLFDTIRMEPGNTTCISTDEKGILYVPNTKDGFIYRIDVKASKLLDNLKCDAFKSPRGISLAPDGNFYVSDMGNNKVHIITKDGKLLGSFGDAQTFTCPRNVYVDRKGLVYVSDCLQKQEGEGMLGRVIVFKKSSDSEWKFEPVVIIDGLKWVECAIADDEGRIYVGAIDGIYVYNDKGERISHWLTKPCGTRMGANIVSGISWGKTGNLLVTQGFGTKVLIHVTPKEILESKE